MMDPSEERLSRLARTMDDINQLELEELARGSGAPPLRLAPDSQLHLNMLRRRIQQQRGIVGKLTRDDLENQYLHALEELEILKKEGNTKDIYIKKLSTKILRLQRSENVQREGDQRDFSASLRTELEQKIRSLENQLRMSKVYGSSLPRRGSKITAEPASNVSRSQTDSLREQIQALENERRDEQEAHRRTVRELQAEIARATEKMTTENARTTMLENIEITRLTRQLAKTSQDLLNMKNDYIDMRPKYEELQINKIVVTRENERLKQEIDRHQQTIETIERQLREAREKSLQQIHDHERANRLESELEWFKRQHQTLRSEPPADSNSRATENFLKLQMKTLEEELQKETKDSQDLRKRLTERETEIEKALRDVSELRAVNLHLKQECEEVRTKLETAIRAEPKKSDGWYQAPPGMRDQEVGEAFRLHDAFRNRRNMSTSTEEIPTNEVIVYRPDPLLLEELEHSRKERENLQRDFESVRENLRRTEEVIARLHESRDQLTQQLEDTRNNLKSEVGATSQGEEIKELQRVLQDKSQQIFQQKHFTNDLERQLKDIAEGGVVYNLEEEEADQSRLSAENVVLKNGDNLLQLHFGPFSFNEDFFAQAQALRIKKWRLKWSVFGENMFAQDSEQSRPDFDFTAIHCVTMDEDIMADLAEGKIRVEIVGIRNDFSRAFAYASFSCRKLLEDSYQRLNRVRDEVPLISQFNVGAEFGCMAYWMRMKFDISQTQALFLARRKALEYVDDNKDNKNSRLNANQIWMKETGKEGNLLHIRISHCRGVKALAGRGPPSPCVLYQFYNNKTTYTAAVSGSENPNFDHQTTFRITTNDSAFHKYLLSQKLDIYVTDSNDHNKDHFLGCCQVGLVDLTRKSLEDVSLPLLTHDRRQNGTVTLSLIWEKPFRSDEKNYEKKLTSARKNRVSMTPRGSLVSVRHTAKLLKINNNLNDGESGDRAANEVSQPRPPPRKSVSRPSRRDTGDVTATSNGHQREDRSDKLENGEGPPKPTRRSSVQQKNRNDERQTDRQTDNQTPRVQADRQADESIQTSPDTGRSVRQTVPPESGNESSLQRRLSENSSSFLKRLGRSETMEKVRRATVGDPVTETANRQTIQAELHPTGSLKVKKTTPFRTFLNGLTKKNSQNSARRLKNGVLAKDRGEDSAQSVTSLPLDVVRIAVHSLYFVENAKILGDFRLGEIFIIFEFLGEEHESPLAVVKPSLPDVVLTFEFEKIFSVDNERNSDLRILLTEMLQKSPPGRIPFSVYFQPDDETMDSELVGVAALSLNRLLSKNQDAIGAELKLVSPTEPGLTVGYMKVTVQAVAVLEDIQRETSS